MIFIIGMKALKELLSDDDHSALIALTKLPKNEDKLKKLKSFFLQSHIFNVIKDQIDPMFLAYEIYLTH
jgi:hypothetical protein